MSIKTKLDIIKYNIEYKPESNIDKVTKTKDELISKKAREHIASNKSKRTESQKKKKFVSSPKREKIKGAITSKKIQKKISIKCAPKIRFSQLFVSPKTTCGKELNALVQDILNNGWDDTKPALKVIEMGDKLPTSLDNRRLFALKKIAATHPDPDIRFSVEKLPGDKAADSLLIGAINAQYKTMSPLQAELAKIRVAEICEKQNIKPYTNGWAVIARMNQTDSDLVRYSFKNSESEIIKQDPLGFKLVPMEKTPQMIKHFSMLKRSGAFK